jgi:hypothetical protein
MGEVENRKRDFLEKRDRNMRRRARKGIVSGESATVILLPEGNMPPDLAVEVRRTTRSRRSTALVVQKTTASDIPRGKLDLRGSHRGPPKVIVRFDSQQFIFDGSVNLFASEPDDCI